MRTRCHPAGVPAGAEPALLEVDRVAHVGGDGRRGLRELQAGLGHRVVRVECAVAIDHRVADRARKRRAEQLGLDLVGGERVRARARVSGALDDEGGGAARNRGAERRARADEVALADLRRRERLLQRRAGCPQAHDRAARGRKVGLEEAVGVRRAAAPNVVASPPPLAPRHPGDQVQVYGSKPRPPTSVSAGESSVYHSPRLSFTERDLRNEPFGLAAAAVKVGVPADQRQRAMTIVASSARSSPRCSCTRRTRLRTS